MEWRWDVMMSSSSLEYPIKSMKYPFDTGTLALAWGEIFQSVTIAAKRKFL